MCQAKWFFQSAITLAESADLIFAYEPTPRLDVSVHLMETYENYHVHLITECPSFIFVLKSPTPSDGDADTLVIANIPPHRYQVKSSGLLAGFATENPAVILNVKKELQAVREMVIEEFEDRLRLVDFLEGLT